jgi:restriction system protein
VSDASGDEAKQERTVGVDSLLTEWHSRRAAWLAERGMPPDFFDDYEEESEESWPPPYLRQAVALQAVASGAPGILEDARASHPEFVIGSSILVLAEPSKVGQLVQAVAIAWDRLLEALDRDPEFLNKLPWRSFEELVAASYKKQGWSVTLTPRSGDGGVDVIAERSDIGRLRVFDQVKRYAPNHVVTRDQVDSMLGLIHRRPDVSKGVITTSSTFAPGIITEPTIAVYMPNRLELRDGAQSPNSSGSSRKSSGKASANSRLDRTTFAFAIVAAQAWTLA